MTIEQERKVAALYKELGAIHGLGSKCNLTKDYCDCPIAVAYRILEQAVSDSDRQRQIEFLKARAKS